MEIVRNDAQTVAINNNVIFDTVRAPGSPSIIYTPGSGLVKLRGVTCSQPRARFKATFGANIAIPLDGAAGAIALALSIDGEPIATTRMIVTPADVGQYFNVGADIFIDIPRGCCGTVAVKVVTGDAVLVQNANLIIERVA